MSLTPIPMTPEQLRTRIKEIKLGVNSHLLNFEMEAIADELERLQKKSCDCVCLSFQGHQKIQDVLSLETKLSTYKEANEKLENDVAELIYQSDHNYPSVYEVGMTSLMDQSNKYKEALEVAETALEHGRATFECYQKWYIEGRLVNRGIAPGHDVAAEYLGNALTQVRKALGKE